MLKARIRALRRKFGSVKPSDWQPPRLIIQWVGARRDSEGRLLGPNFNFTKAEIRGRVFERGENETLAAFEARVEAEMPAVGGDAAFWSDDEQSH